MPSCSLRVVAVDAAVEVAVEAEEVVVVVEAVADAAVAVESKESSESKSRPYFAISHNYCDFIHITTFQFQLTNAKVLILIRLDLLKYCM